MTIRKMQQYDIADYCNLKGGSVAGKTFSGVKIICDLSSRRFNNGHTSQTEEP